MDTYNKQRIERLQGTIRDLVQSCRKKQKTIQELRKQLKGTEEKLAETDMERRWEKMRANRTFNMLGGPDEDVGTKGRI